MNLEDDLSPAMKESRMTTSGTVSKAPLRPVSTSRWLCQWKTRDAPGMTCDASGGTGCREKAYDISQQGNVRCLHWLLLAWIVVQIKLEMSSSAHQRLLLFRRELLVLHGIQRYRLIFLEVNGELVEVPVLDFLRRFSRSA